MTNEREFILVATSVIEESDNHVHVPGLQSPFQPRRATRRRVTGRGVVSLQPANRPARVSATARK